VDSLVVAVSRTPARHRSAAAAAFRTAARPVIPTRAVDITTVAVVVDITTAAVVAITTAATAAPIMAALTEEDLLLEQSLAQWGPPQPPPQRITTKIPTESIITR